MSGRNSETHGRRGRIAGAIILSALVLPKVVREFDRRRGGREAPPPGDAGGRDVMIRSADGTPLHINISGEGPRTLFCVHGWMCNGTIYCYQKEFLRDAFRVVTLDLRGHGGSGIPESLDYHPDRLAEDLKAAVDFVDPPEFAVAGHSMGGFTAFKFYEHFGHEYEGRLKGLVIIDSTGTDLVDGLVLGGLAGKMYPRPLAGLLDALGRRNTVSERLKALTRNTSYAYLLVRWAAFGKSPDAAHVEYVREMVTDTPITSAAMAARSCLDFHYDYFLPETRVPVLLLVGEKDKLTNLEVNERTLHLLPQGRMVPFPGAGHSTLLERRDEFNRELSSFLDACFAGSRPVGESR